MRSAACCKCTLPLQHEQRASLHLHEVLFTQACQLVMIDPELFFGLFLGQEGRGVWLCIQEVSFVLSLAALDFSGSCFPENSFCGAFLKS